MCGDLDAVLVHGAFHGPWSFERVISGLADCGLSASAVDLLSHHDAGELQADATAVCQALDELMRLAVLVGHSYGGAVITQAGDHPAVRHLVYLAAIAPDETEICGEPFLPEGTASVDSIAAAVATMDPETAASQFYNDCDEETIAWAVERLRPQPLAWMAQRPSAAAWRTKPSTYVVCSADRTIDPDRQRDWAKRCSTSVEWNSSHSPNLSHPEWVVDLVASLIRGSS